jgi:hypothetical protein
MLHVARNLNLNTAASMHALVRLTFQKAQATLTAPPPKPNLTLDPQPHFTRRYCHCHIIGFAFSELLANLCTFDPIATSACGVDLFGTWLHMAARALVLIPAVGLSSFILLLPSLSSACWAYSLAT